MRLAMLFLPLALLFAQPASAADLEGPVYRERRTTVIEHPPVVERRVIEHHHYYQPAPRPVYVERDYYAPRVYGYYVRPLHAQLHLGHRHFRHHRWHGHRHHGWRQHSWNGPRHHRW